MEGTWSMRNTLKLDQEYFDKYKNDPSAVSPLPSCSSASAQDTALHALYRRRQRRRGYGRL
ncbi:MAG: hypothetical protein ACLRM8_03710 [Alistipes sp.]